MNNTNPLVRIMNILTISILIVSSIICGINWINYGCWPGQVSMQERSVNTANDLSKAARNVAGVGAILRFSIPKWDRNGDYREAMEHLSNMEYASLILMLSADEILPNDARRVAKYICSAGVKVLRCCQQVEIDDFQNRQEYHRNLDRYTEKLRESCKHMGFRDLLKKIDKVEVEAPIPLKDLA